jgi:hypothetical protein
MRPISRITLLFLAAVLCGLLTGGAAADEASYPSPALSHGPRCMVPKLIGLSLPEVRQVFEPPAHTWCKLGTIRGPRRRSVVVRQSPKPRQFLPWGTRVNVRLARSPGRGA